MALKHAAKPIALIAVMATALIAGTLTAATGPLHDSSVDKAGAERLVLRMGTMRGSIEPGAAPVDGAEAKHTKSAAPSAHSILPALTPFSGPAFALFHEPIARPMPARPVRIVYGGSVIVASAQRW